MSQTVNYGLQVVDNSRMKVKDYIEGMADATNSNMVKIDDVLGDKADHSRHIAATLAASGWTGVDKPYSYTLLIPGLEADRNGYLQVSQSATFDERQMVREAMLCITGQEAGKLYISADGEMPDIDIPVDIILLD